MRAEENIVLVETLQFVEVAGDKLKVEQSISIGPLGMEENVMREDE